MAERLYNVVIEQPRSPAPGAAAALAAAISARYGIPAADLERRISKGRFRVKSRVDRATADTYASDLNRLGAVCVVQAVDEGPAAFSGPIEVPAQGQVAARRDPGPPPGTEPGRPRLSPETLPPSSASPSSASVYGPPPSTDPGRPRFAPDSLQLATDPGRPATDPARPRVTAEAARPATDPARPRVTAEAARPATDPGRARVAAEAARPATDPGRARVPAEAVRPTEPAPPRAGQPLDLGALSGGFPLTLSTLDGASDGGGHRGQPQASANLPASFGPSTSASDHLPASFGPSTTAPAHLPASFGPSTSASDHLPASFGPSTSASDHLPASFGPAPTPAPAPQPSPASSGSRLPRADSSPPIGPTTGRGPTIPAPESVVDRFAPPPAAAVDVEVALDTETRHRRETPTAAATAGRVQEVPWPAATLPPRISETRPGATMAPGAAIAGARTGSGLRDPRVRLVLGAVLAVGVGFVPAHFVGAMREKAAYATIDADLARRQTSIRSREDYAAFDAVRAAHAERKRAARQDIALASLALWALVGGGVAWLWFRRIDWDHLLGPAR